MWCSFSLTAEAFSFASPQLQLSQTALFTAVPEQKQTVVGTIRAANTGDGALQLSFAPTASWLSAAIAGAPAGCASYPNATQCFGIQITVDTTSLPVGSYAGNVYVNDPNAIDAPQNIVVTIIVGGPQEVNVYIPPTGRPFDQFVNADTITFSASNLWQPLQSGVQFTIVVPTVTTFGMRVPYYYVAVTAAPGTPEGRYEAAYTISGLGSPDEDGIVPVAIHVTNQPIAVASSTSVEFESSSGSAAQTQPVTFSNYGLGALAIGSVQSDSSWLSGVVNTGSSVTISADPSALPPGTYTGSLTVTGNEANPVVIAVTFDVAALGPPQVTGNALIPLGDFATIRGSNFTTYAAQTADMTQALPTSINGTSVLIGTEAAPLLSVAYGSITLQVPYDANASFLQVVREDGALSDPFPISISCYPTLTKIVDANGIQVDTYAPGSIYPQPLVDAGSPITIVGHGFGQTNPPAPSGTPIPQPSLFGSPAYVTPALLELYDDLGKVFKTADAVAQLEPGMIDIYQISTTVPKPPAGAARPVDVNLLVWVCGESSQSLAIRVR